MKKQILSAVPDWFDIGKYAPVADFDIFDWFSSISFRLVLLSAFDGKSLLELNDRLKRDGLQVRGDDREFYLEILKKLLDQPANETRRKRKNSECGLPTAKPVRDMTVHDVMGVAEELHKSEKYQAAWEAWEWSMNTSEEWILERLKDKHGALENSAGDYMNEMFPSAGHLVYAEVDIHAPLDDLVESFKEWVQKVKSSRGVPFHSKRAFTELDFKRWHRYAILPYFDLKLWAMSEGAHIPDWLYVDALFGDVQGDTDGMFRKNTKPLERQVMTQACVDQLRNQGDIYW